MRKLSFVSFATPAITALLLTGCASTGKHVAEQTVQLNQPGYLVEKIRWVGGPQFRYARYGSVTVKTSGELPLASGKLWFLFGQTQPVAWDDLYQYSSDDKGQYYFMTRAEHDAGKTKMHGYYDVLVYLCANGRNPAEAKDQCAEVVSATVTTVVPQSGQLPSDTKEHRTMPGQGRNNSFVDTRYDGATAADYDTAHAALIAEVERSKRAAAAAETRRREEYAEGERQARAFFKGAKVGTQVSCSSVSWMARMEMPSDRTVFNCQQAGTILYRDLQSNGWVVTNMIQQPGVDVRGDPISNYAISIRKVR